MGRAKAKPILNLRNLSIMVKPDMKQLSLVFLLAVVCGVVQANSQVWLSDQPPDKRMLKDMRRSHGGYVYIEDDVFVKRLWLRKGDSLAQSAYVAVPDDEFTVLDINKNPIEVSVQQDDKGHSIRFKMPDEGYYNAYYTERSLEGDTLFVNTAKTEVLKHSCRLGHNYDRKLVVPNQWDGAPLEIIRVRLPEEDFHTRLRSGVDLNFKVLHYGQPVQGARVRLESHKGWVNSTTTNKEGIANFQMIQDNFVTEEDEDQQLLAKFLGDKKGEKSGESSSAKGRAYKAKAEQEQQPKPRSSWERNARPRDSFLLNAEYVTDEAGKWNGQPYQQTVYTVTMPGTYEPNIQVAQSKMWGLA
ncbi:MAG: hypothetical protein ACU836_18210, partial [Gammaproteobacteria bacterium]